MKVEVFIDLRKKDMFAAAGSRTSRPVVVRHGLLTLGAARMARRSIAAAGGVGSVVSAGNEWRVFCVMLFYVKLGIVFVVAAIAASEWAGDGLSHVDGVVKVGG